MLKINLKKLALIFVLIVGSSDFCVSLDNSPHYLLVTNADLADQKKSEFYLLLTSEKLVDGFSALVQHRASQGLLVHIRLVEAIQTDYPGIDLQEKIRNCIIDCYLSREEPNAPFFVALGGDVGFIPVRYCYPRADANPVPADLYYADIDGGNWDEDGDGRYGEPEDMNLAELTPEVYLGRIPVNTVQEVRDYVNKVQIYEDTSPDNFVDSLILVTGDATIMHGNLNKIANERLTGNNRPKELLDHDPVGRREKKLFIDRYVEQIQPYWQATPLHRFFTYVSCWDQYQCGDYSLTRAHLTERLNPGYHFVWFFGHGSANTWVLRTGEAETNSFRAVEALSLNNTERLSIVFGGGCSTAYFDWEKGMSLGEAFICNPAGGAVVYFGWARSIGGNNLMSGLKECIFREGIRCVGEAFARAETVDAENHLKDAYKIYIFTLLGDPAICIKGPERDRHLQIIAPKGCERVKRGMSLPVRWNAGGTGYGPDEEVEFEYSPDGGLTWHPVTGGQHVPYNNCVMYWDTSSLIPSTEYQIRVTSASEPGVSAESGKFSIVEMGTLTVRCPAIQLLRVSGTHANVTDYTYSVVIGETVELDAPAHKGELGFVGWFDESGRLLNDQTFHCFPFTEDTTVVAIYQ